MGEQMEAMFTTGPAATPDGKNIKPGDGKGLLGKAGGKLD
jgi:hypothetical protein